MRYRSSREAATCESPARQCREAKVAQSRVPEGRHTSCDRLARPHTHTYTYIHTYIHTYAGWSLRLIFFQSIFFQSILVRRRERISMNRKISSNPREAVRMVWARLGSRE